MESNTVTTSLQIVKKPLIHMQYKIGRQTQYETDMNKKRAQIQ
jgi:hypothetical protein